jgi:IS4 transposase
LEGEKVFSNELQSDILRILKKGNTVELKKENGKLVVVEIHRKVKTKTSITG